MYCIYGNSSWYNNTYTTVRYSEEVRYWEGALSEVPQYRPVGSSIDNEPTEGFRRFIIYGSSDPTFCMLTEHKRFLKK